MRFDQLERRKFLSLLGVTTAWSLSARAQQAMTPVIGVLSGPSLGESTQLVAAFRQGLSEAGYVGVEMWRWNTDGLTVNIIGFARSRGTW